MNRQILITVLLFVMMGCRQPESINCNLIFIGDSISEGIGVENPMEESAPAVAGNLMKESGNVRFANCALYASYNESNISADKGLAASPVGAGIFFTICSRTSSILMPFFAEINGAS